MIKNSDEIAKLREEITLIRDQRTANKRIFWPQDIRDQVLEFHNQGWRINQLEAELQISNYTIGNWIHLSRAKKKAITKDFREVSVVDKSEKFSTKAVRLVFEIGRLHVTIESKDRSELLSFLEKVL